MLVTPYSHWHDQPPYHTHFYISQRVNVRFSKYLIKCPASESLEPTRQCLWEPLSSNICLENCQALLKPQPAGPFLLWKLPWAKLVMNISIFHRMGYIFSIGLVKFYFNFFACLIPFKTMSLRYKLQFLIFHSFFHD